MPLVRIDLLAGKSADYRRTVGATVHQAMTELINVPVDDRFQIITEHPSDGFNMTARYLGIDYSADLIVIQITLNGGRTVAMKQALFRAVADRLHEALAIRREDVLISLVEVSKENWSFGNGAMQYGPPPE